MVIWTSRSAHRSIGTVPRSQGFNWGHLHLGYLGLGCLGLSILLTACPSSMTVATPSPRPPAPATTPTAAPAQPNLGQQLPIGAQGDFRGHRIQLEVARTPQQQAIGLMYRTDLAADRGMIFPQNRPRPMRFWMKNTLIPLDMLFLRQGVIRHIAANALPCKADPCATYGTTELVDQVIELRAGQASALGLQIGDRVTLQFYNSPPRQPSDPVTKPLSEPASKPLR